MRRLLWIVIALVLGIVWAAPATATHQIRVFVNDRDMAFDVPPEVMQGRTLVPLRVIFEALGAEVGWDGATKTVHARWSDGEMELPIGAEQAWVRGQERKLDVPGQIVKDRTLVPLRFVAEAMGAQVGWHGQSRIITVNKAAKPLVSAIVSRVVDGDTVEVALASGGSEKVRLIGVDTPETVHPEKGEEPGGRTASDYTKAQLTGQQVLLELDVEERDRYGRLLAYVYTTNGTMFNAVLAEEGLARMATFPPNVRYIDLFGAIQRDAAEAKRGLWRDEPPLRPKFDSSHLPPSCANFEMAGVPLCEEDNHGGSQQVAPPPQPPKPTTPPAVKHTPFGPDRDCKDFTTHAEAQAFYEAAGGPGRDPHRLDADRDGIACESLP